MIFSKRIAFIGAGNVAFHLAPALENVGFPVAEIYSRDKKKARNLTKRLYSASHHPWGSWLESKCQVFFLTLPDQVVMELARTTSFPPESTIVHTSGSVGLDAIAEITGSAGVFYPVQTFSQDQRLNFEHLPVLLEATDKSILKDLQMMGKALTRQVLAASSEERKQVHLAAVFASNFSNHLLAISESILSGQKLPLGLLEPLIKETIRKAFEIGPEAAQTGPARRGDMAILDEHLNMLEENDPIAEIYRILSQHILDQYFN